MRYEQQAKKQRREDEPVEQEVADVEGDAGPGIGREGPQPRRQEVAVGAQLLQLGGLGESFVPCDRVAAALGEGVEDGLIVALVKAPGRQPAADVAAARHRRQIMEMSQQPVGGESLQDAERKGGAADATAGEAERGSRNRQTVNALIKLEHIRRRRAVRDARIAGCHLLPFDQYEFDDIWGGTD